MLYWICALGKVIAHGITTGLGSYTVAWHRNCPPVGAFDVSHDQDTMVYTYCQNEIEGIAIVVFQSSL